MEKLQLYEKKLTRLIQLYEGLVKDLALPPLIEKPKITTTTITVSKKRPKVVADEEEEGKKRRRHVITSTVTKESLMKLVPPRRIIPIVEVTVREQELILARITEMLGALPTRASRFRRSHELPIVTPTVPLIFHDVEVLLKSDSDPDCIVCNGMINKGEDRCRVDLNLTESRVDNLLTQLTVTNEIRVDFCVTHSYHVKCYLFCKHTCSEGHFPVCTGTFAGKGGCRQPNFE
jgi:hypothetical protein